MRSWLVSLLIVASVCIGTVGAEDGPISIDVCWQMVQSGFLRVARFAERFAPGAMESLFNVQL
jgi:hypothetical protein